MYTTFRENIPKNFLSALRKRYRGFLCHYLCKLWTGAIQSSFLFIWKSKDIQTTNKEWYSEFFWTKVKWFSEFDFTAKFWVFKFKMRFWMAGEDKKTLTIFSSLTKNSVKFFSQNRFTRAFLLLFATSLTSTATAATRPLKLKKLSFRSCKRLREMVYYQKFK